MEPAMPLPAPAIGDRLRVTDGPFNGFDAVVRAVHEDPPHLSIEVTVFGRPVPILVEPWQVDAAAT
jgi:transcription termination/antitermination protein NusG